MYQNGHGVTQNFMEAANWYLKSAQADNPNAQFLLGLSYKEGSGVPRDPMESYKWILLAAEAGNTQHVAARQALEQSYTPAMIAEGRRRADQFRMYRAYRTSPPILPSGTGHRIRNHPTFPHSGPEALPKV